MSVEQVAHDFIAKGDKVSRMDVASPPDRGIPAALAPLGIKMPGM